MMERTDFAPGTIWGILPEKMDDILKTYRLFLADDIEAANVRWKAASFGHKKVYEPELEIRDGAAVIPVSGPITRRMSLFSFIFRSTAVDRIRMDIDQALADPGVRAIVLDIDSPGGTVSGLDTLAEYIYSVRGEKPIVAHTGGLMCSAAYWIGSAASRVMAEKTARVGSIGVLTVHADFSKMDERIGVKYTYLTAGRYKALGNDAEPLSELARETIQAELDHIYGIFVEAVARNRGADPEAVREGMADGRVFIGRQAQDAGLVDAIGTLEDAVQTALADAGQPQPYRAKSPTTKEVTEMFKTAAELAQAQPDLAEELRKEGEARVDLAPVKTDAVRAEQARILELAAIQFGEEDGQKFKAIVEQGITTDQFKAIMALAGGRKEETDPDAEFKKDMLEAIQKSAIEPLGAGGGPDVGGGDFMSMVKEYRQEQKCSRAEAIRAVRKDNPKAFDAYMKQVNQGS